MRFVVTFMPRLAEVLKVLEMEHWTIADIQAAVQMSDLPKTQDSM